MNYPIFPKDFQDCDRSRRFTEEELISKINQEIKRMLDFMIERNIDNQSVSFQDILIIIDRVYEDDEVYFEVSVSEKHTRTRVKL